MSELLIEHPIVLIENFLKLGIGDEGRLLYLRKAIQNGKKIYDSDKNYLKKMVEKREEIQKLKTEDTQINYQNKNSLQKTNFISIPSVIDKKPENNYSKQNKKSPEKNLGITKIQNLIFDLKKINSKLMDNLELLLISREISTQSKTVESSSSGSFYNPINTKNADLFDLLKNNPKSKNIQSVRIKKYKILAPVSVGLFAFWFAGYQNIVNIEPTLNAVLGISAGIAGVTASVFYIKQKNSSK